MSHKVHPTIFRIRSGSDWKSRWFDKEKTAEFLREDFEIRQFIEKRLKDAGIDSIEIERVSGKVIVIVNSARPGLIIGRGGSGVDALKKGLQKLLLNIRASVRKRGKNETPAHGKKSPELQLDIKEVKNPWESAPLVGQWVAQQLEKRMPHRRTLKQAIGKVMMNKNIQGAKIEVAGRLGGTDIARREWLKEGRLPLQTIRANIEFECSLAKTTYGTIGVKVWLYKGDRFEKKNEQRPSVA